MIIIKIKNLYLYSNLNLKYILCLLFNHQIINFTNAEGHILNLYYIQAAMLRTHKVGENTVHYTHDKIK